MVKRLLALLAAALLLPGSGTASIAWREKTPAQKQLKEYITNANAFLADQGEQEINTCFEMYDAQAVLGITSAPNAETPEGVEVTVKLYYDTVNSVELRVDEVERFPVIAGALIRALYPESMTAEEAMKAPSARAKAATSSATRFSASRVK